MKINLECGEETREGYVNIHSMPTESKTVLCNFRNLDEVAQDGTAEEIIANGVITKMTPQEIAEVVGHWINKLKVDGELSIAFVDIRQICKEGHVGNFTVENLHQFIFGSNYENKALCDLDIMRNLLTQFGLKITFMTCVGCVTTIKAKKCLQNTNS